MNEITDEQRAAWGRLLAANNTGYQQGRHSMVSDLEAISAALPSELTDPQPVLPGEPGQAFEVAFHDGTAGVAVRTDQGLTALLVDGRILGGCVASAFVAPFTRLVPKREPITREQIEDVLTDNFRLPPWRMSALLGLVNGTDRD